MNQKQFQFQFQSKQLNFAHLFDQTKIHHIINKITIIINFSLKIDQLINLLMTLNPQYDAINTTSKKEHDQIKARFTNFLQSFEQQKGISKYVKIAKQMLERQGTKMVIKTSDFLKHDPQIAEKVFGQYSRYEDCLNDSLTYFMSHLTNIHDYKVRIQEDDQKLQEQQERYQVGFDLGIIKDTLEESVRSLKCEMLGKLRSIVGTVTRVSQIRPELLDGIFSCDFCGRMSLKIPQQYKYTLPKKCLGQGCQNNHMWTLFNKHSIFANFQKIRLQQDASKIPPGSMPRSIDVILRNQNIDKGQPGDQIHVVGYLAVIPDIQSLLKPGQRTAIFTRNPKGRNEFGLDGINGIKGIKQLSYKLCFIANNIFVMNNQFNQQVLTPQQADQLQIGLEDGYNQEQIMSKLLSKFDVNEIRQIQIIKDHPRMYDQLAESLFHQIFGHNEIKKALLLQLLGGIHKKTQTKISLRGDINILIVGDPSTAKSQFLKCINKFVPRSVYTNGKTTTAAGLTASVVRDQETGNVSIEAGALLLADNGICCIDQFDKMDMKDQVAIHEAMQQQTISIAKAGVQATLHARTSILAAANPIFGRYDKTQSLRKNINISPPIMSRFDLYFIICDVVNQEADTYLSQFIVGMHSDNKKVQVKKPYTMKQIKNYLTIARKIKPRLTKQAALLLRQKYVQLRRKDKQSYSSQYLMTVRQLQSMVRLSEAFAKLHLEFEVKQSHVRQAYRLLSSSQVKLQKATCQLVDEQGITQNEKISLGLGELLDNQKQVKKEKKIIIEHEVFEQIKKSICDLFYEKQKRHRKYRIDDVENYITEEDVIFYLLTINYQNNDLGSEFENQQGKKLYRSIIKKLVQQQILVVLSENEQNPQKRHIFLHPNVENANKVKKQIQKDEDQIDQNN